MNVTLKPFDFAQAVARAGLATNGQPLQNSKPVQGAGFQQALTNALGAVSKSQSDASNLQRRLKPDLRFLHRHHRLLEADGRVVELHFALQVAGVQL